MEQNYIYFIFAGRWNWEELAPAAEAASKMASSVKHPVCYVIHLMDEIGRRHVPPNVLAYATASKSCVPPNVEKLIIVNASSVTFGILSVVFRLAPDLQDFFTYAPTIEEAQRLAILGRQAKDLT